MTRVGRNLVGSTLIESRFVALVVGEVLRTNQLSAWKAYVMPKMKTKKMAAKKFRVGGTGRIKRGRAFRSHLTSKRSPKRMRNLRENVSVDVTNAGAIRRMLPYG